MLTQGMAQAFNHGTKRVAAGKGVSERLSKACQPRQAAAQLYQVSGDDWLADTSIHEEVFGPLGIIVFAKDFEQMRNIAPNFRGQLTCTIHMDDGDHDHAQDLLPVLERKAGRVLANGYPTGVEVCDSMVHGGPYPASTNFGATSVGTMAIRRFLRPVCYQDMPVGLIDDLAWLFCNK